MPTWPTTKAGTTHLDAGTDNPGSARVDILQNVTNVNSMIDTIVVTSPTATQVLSYDSVDSRFENVSIDTIALTASNSATLTNKAGSNSQWTNDEAFIKTSVANTYTKQQVVAMATLTDAASITWDLSTQQTATVTLTDNRALANPTNQVAGATYVIIVKQDGTGSRTLSYGTDYKFPGGTAPTLSIGASDVDVVCFVSDGTYLYGSALLDFS
jgi:hypothetical protein